MKTNLLTRKIALQLTIISALWWRSACSRPQPKPAGVGPVSGVVEVFITGETGSAAVTRATHRGHRSIRATTARIRARDLTKLTQ